MMEEIIVVKTIVTKELFKDNTISALIENFSYEEIINFVQELDERVSNWDYTIKLYEYYKDAYKVFLEEEKLFSSEG